MTKIRTRYAPSPTGKMHVGNLRSALYEFLIAKHEGGDFMLRIEDTDQERFVEGATEIIYRTLEKTGLIHDEGPDKDGGYGPYVQSERMKTGIYLPRRCATSTRTSRSSSQAMTTSPSKTRAFCLTGITPSNGLPIPIKHGIK